MCLLSELIVSRSLAVAGRAQAGDRPFPEPGVRPHYAPDRTCVVTHLDIGLRIDPASPGLEGDTVVTLAPLPSGRFEAKLDLDDVVVTSVTDLSGAELPFRHADGVLDISGLPATGGGARIRYRGLPSRGLYFTGPTSFAPTRPPMAWTQCQDEDGHFLFPCHDQPGKKQPVRLRVTAPAGLEVVGNGRLAAKEDDGAWTTWTWEQDEPIPAYLVTVVVGPMTVVETTADNAGASLPVRYLAPGVEDTARLQRIFGNTPAMISFLAGRFGVPYPWARYDQVVVHDFIFGGMENVAATTLTDLVLTDDRAALDTEWDDLIVHELAHQWFGDLLTCQDWSQAWLNEGWATYTEYLWQDHAEGADEGLFGLMGKLDGYLSEDGGRYRRSITHYRFRNPIDLFDRHLYEKGGLVLHTLRRILGEEAFWAGTTGYLEAHAGGAVHTRDFQRAMERASGRNLDGFFQQFVHGDGHPELTVAVSHGDGILSVSIEQKQVGTDVAEVFRFPLELLVVGDDGEETPLRLPVEERQRAWAIPMPKAPARVEVDPKLGVVAKVTVKAGKALLKAALSGGSTVPVRVRAAEALLEDGTVEAVRALADAVAADAFWGVRAKVAGLLAKQGGTVAREALLGALSDPHPKARRAIVAALGAFRDATVADALAALVAAGDASVLVEGEAVKSLGRVRDGRARGIAAPYLEQDSWADTLRMRALDALGATREPDVLPLLLAHTADRFLPRTRAAAATALGQLAAEVEAVRLAAADRLSELAVESPFRVRLAALSALGRARHAPAAAVLRRVHTSDPDGRVARTAYEALQSLSGGDAEVAKLRDQVEKLVDQNRSLRERIDKLEGRLGDA